MNTKQHSYFEYDRDIDEMPSLSLPNAMHNIDAHFHKQFELFYVTKGQAHVTINGEERTLFENQLALCDSFDVHSLCTPTENDMAISLIIPFYLMADYRGKKGDRQLSKRFVLECGQALRFKVIIDTLYSFSPNDGNPVAQDLLRSLLSLVAEAVGFSDKKEKNSFSLGSEILQYISDHCCEEISLESVATRFGYSPYYFSKLFSSTFRTSFNVYLNTLRLKQALFLIRKESFSVLDAALHAGFGSEATFYRFVKTHYGATPKRLLEMLPDEQNRILKAKKIKNKP